MDNASKRIAKLQDEYDKAKKTGEDVSELKKKLEDAKKNETLKNAQYKAMIDETTNRIANANQIALDYINNQTAGIYVTNYNSSKETADKYNVNFTQVDERVVKNLMQEKHLNIQKDKKWNSKQLNSAVLQGILQGESINKIAKRIMPICDNNSKSAIRNARTMVTQAENKGRLDGYKELENEGLILTKVWVATEDDRTRASHLEINGEEVGIDEEFSNGLMYPADPDGDPEEVYNCRCTMVTNVVGRDGEQVDESANEIVQGKDISETWERRPDQFDFAIEDIINAQGFDGLPRVVDADKFENAVKESKIYMSRGFSAPSEEIAKKYENEFLNGSFYVECSGGCAYGRGMYCAGTNQIVDNKIIDEVFDIAKRYSKKENSGIVQEMTLMPNAKIITTSELKKKKKEIFGDIDDYVYKMKKEMKSKQDKVYKDFKDGKITKEQAIKLDSKIEDDYHTKKSLLSDGDDGELASLLGYDALVVPNAEGNANYYVILNRTKVIVKRS